MMPANLKVAIVIAVLGLIGFICWVSWHNSSDQKAPAPRSPPPALTAPTTVTGNGCGTSPRASLPSSDSAESTEDARN